MIKDRLYKLCKSYFEKCISNDKPPELNCFKEYKRYANDRILKHEKILCATKKFMDEEYKQKENENANLTY
jgi:hypothetical protein